MKQPIMDSLRFPGGKTRALTFSYDDGVLQDRRLVGILNDHGLKGTFNIGSGVLGYVDPNVTVDIIREGRLAEKRRVGLPTKLTNVLRCKNPRCITSTEQELPHVFLLTDPEHRIYRCMYCETRAK